jgi:two-component system, cell cycle sensor histidine kinase and response regulator CckA
MKVLLIEDDILVGKLISQQLKFQNFEVYLALDGAEAIDIYISQQIDVIVSDLLLPNMSGLSALKTIQNISTNTPLVVISSLNDIPTLLENAGIQFSSYIQKPFSAQQLISKIHSAADMHQTSKASGL